MVKRNSIPKFRDILTFAYNHPALCQNGVMAELPIMLVIVSKNGRAFTLHSYLKKWACQYAFSPEIYLTDYTGNCIGVQVDWNRCAVGFYPV